MSKFETVRQEPKNERPWDIHPIWRGIGCIFLFLVPVMSYLSATLIIQANIENKWVPIPEELVGPEQIPFLFANLLVTLLIMVAVFGVLFIIYSIVYQSLGPPKYGPTDAPPPRKKIVRKRKRK